MKRLGVLGCTGSVGEQTLAVAALHPERFQVVALAAGRNVARLAEQVARFRPQVVSVADEAGAQELRERIGDRSSRGIQIGFGSAGLEAVATQPADLVMAALVGSVGLAPTLAAVRAGRDVALANKEVMVMAGALIRREVAARGRVRQVGVGEARARTGKEQTLSARLYPQRTQANTSKHNLRKPQTMERRTRKLCRRVNLAHAS